MHPKLLSLSALAAGGCVAGAITPPLHVPSLADNHVSYAEWTQLNTEVNDDLQRLRELDILEVGTLIVDAPAASGFCYGPCEDDPVDQAWLQEFAKQAARLDALADHAEALDPLPLQTDAILETLRADVDALQALQIIDLDSAFQESSNCYIPICSPEEEERVTRIAGHLHALTLATGEL